MRPYDRWPIYILHPFATSESSYIGESRGCIKMERGKAPANRISPMSNFSEVAIGWQYVRSAIAVDRHDWSAHRQLFMLGFWLFGLDDSVSRVPVA